MSVNAILAIEKSYGIGYNNDLPWPMNKKDMQWFRENTRGHVVVMGRSTWESLGSKKLPQRTNVVISSQDIEGPDLVLNGNFSHIVEQLSEKFSGLHVWIIGGANIYTQALPYCDKLYLTQFKRDFECDTFMDRNAFDAFTVVEHLEEDDEMIIEIRGKE